MGIINKYDRPAEHKFINTYSPIPFAELAAAGGARQARLDENLGRLDAAQAAANAINYIPNSKDQARVEEIQTGLSNLADEFIDKDLSDPEVYRKLRGGIRQIADPNEIKAIEGSFQGWQNYQKMAAEYKAKGKQIYDPFDFQDYNTTEAGIFTDLPMMNLTDQVPAKFEEFLTRPQTSDTPFYEELSGRYGTRKQRDLNEIYNLIENNVGELSSDPAVQQWMAEQGMQSPEELQKFLADMAPNYEIEDIQNLAWRPGTGRDTETEDPGYDYLAGQPIIDPNIESNKSIRQTTIKAKDYFPGLKVGKRTLVEFLTTSGKEADELKQLEFEDKTQEKEFNEYLKAAEEYYGGTDYNNLSPKEKLNKVDEYIRHRQTRERAPMNTIVEDPKVVKSEDQLVGLGMLNDAPVYNMSGGVEQNLMSLRDLKQEYPTGGTNPHTYHVSGLATGDIPRAELAGARQIDIEGPQGEYVGTFYVGVGEEKRKGFNFRNALVRNMLYNEPLAGSTKRNYMPKGEFEFPHQGLNWKIKWKVEDSEDGLPLYSAQIIYPEEAWGDSGVERGSAPLNSKAAIKGHDIGQIYQNVWNWLANEQAE